MCRTQLPSPCAEGRCRFVCDMTHNATPQMLRTTVATGVPKVGLHLSAVSQNTAEAFQCPVTSRSSSPWCTKELSTRPVPEDSEKRRSNHDPDNRGCACHRSNREAVGNLRHTLNHLLSQRLGQSNLSRNSVHEQAQVDQAMTWAQSGLLQAVCDT